MTERKLRFTDALEMIFDNATGEHRYTFPFTGEKARPTYYQIEAIDEAGFLDDIPQSDILGEAFQFAWLLAELNLKRAGGYSPLFSPSKYAAGSETRSEQMKRDLRLVKKFRDFLSRIDGADAPTIELVSDLRVKVFRLEREIADGAPLGSKIWYRNKYRAVKHDLRQMIDGLCETYDLSPTERAKKHLIDSL